MNVQSFICQRLERRPHFFTDKAADFHISTFPRREMSAAQATDAYKEDVLDGVRLYMEGHVSLKNLQFDLQHM
jgi:hypothetical protein